MTTRNDGESGQVNNAQVGSSVENKGLVKNRADGVGRSRVPQREAIPVDVTTESRDADLGHLTYALLRLNWSISASVETPI